MVINTRYEPFLHPSTASDQRLHGKWKQRPVMEGGLGETRIMERQKPTGLKQRLREAGEAYVESRSRADSAAIDVLVREAVQARWAPSEIARATLSTRDSALKRMDKARKFFELAQDDSEE